MNGVKSLNKRLDMSFQKGDKVKHKPGVVPEELSKNEYVVLEYFVNIAKQKTVRLENLVTIFLIFEIYS